MKSGWQTKAIGDVCAIKPPKSEARAALNSRDLVSFVPMEDLPIGSKALSLNHERPLSEVASGYTYFADGDVLLAKITPCFENGKLGIASRLKNGIGFGSSEYIVLRPNSALSNEWLYYYLARESFRREGASRMSGAVGHKRVPQEFIERYPIPVPPISEQKRIVTILDQAFEAIDTAESHAERNLLNAKELSEGSLESLFEQRGQEWEKTSLQQLLDRGWIEGHLDGNHGSDYPRKQEFVSSGVPYISANCIEDGAVVMSRAKYLSPARAAKIHKGVARNGDVLFAHNATVGPVAILQISVPHVILGTSLTYYRCNKDFILPEYLALYMTSSLFVKQYSQVMQQSTRNQVPITKQREFTHVVPPKIEQEAIVHNLTALFKRTTQLRSINVRKTARLQDLRGSLLASAFCGAL